jgi:arylsulfatase A-like enzyme
VRNSTLAVCLFSLLALPTRAQEASRLEMAVNAILVGWDGAHRDHVKALLKEGKLPHLQKLINQGSLVDIDVTSGHTDTKAGWVQILTGYRPEVTGVYSNRRFRDVPAGYSIFERLRAQFGANNVATVAVIGKWWHCGEIDPPLKRPYDSAKDGPYVDRRAGNGRHVEQPGSHGHQYPPRVVEENGTKYLVFNGSPYYTMHKSVDQWQFGLMKDERVGDKALEMLDQYGKRPFFFFVHFAQVDHSGHRYGEGSQQYNAAIISGDQQLGRIMEKLKQLGVSRKTLIYVTADHGFDLKSKHHRDAPYVFLATNDRTVVRDGTRADIGPTILARLGVDVSKITPPLDGHPLTSSATRPAAKANGKPESDSGSRRKRRPVRAG